MFASNSLTTLSISPCFSPTIWLICKSRYIPIGKTSSQSSIDVVCYARDAWYAIASLITIRLLLVRRAMVAVWRIGQERSSNRRHWLLSSLVDLVVRLRRPSRSAIARRYARWERRNDLSRLRLSGWGGLSRWSSLLHECLSRRAQWRLSHVFSARSMHWSSWLWHLLLGRQCRRRTSSASLSSDQPCHLRVPADLLLICQSCIRSNATLDLRLSFSPCPLIDWTSKMIHRRHR